MFKLIAMNDQGASVVFKAATQKATLNKFDSEYHRSGWRIHIEKEEGEIVRIVRDTFRKSNCHVLHNGYK